VKHQKSHFLHFWYEETRY